MKNSKTRLLWPSLIGPLLAAPFVSWGQVEGPGYNGPEAEEPVFELSPFAVTSDADEGYRTRQIVTGTKLATPLHEAPLTVGVINRELLTDINLDRVIDAVAFTQAGVANRGRTWTDSESFIFRGYDGAILRNGVRFSAWTDASSIERVEVAKGPSAILYGFVAPGGVVNYVTKRPFAGRAASAKLRWSTNYGLRSEVDLNTPLIFDDDRLLFRFTGARTDGDTWIRYQEIHDTVLTPTFSLRLTPDTTLSYELAYRKREGPFERIRFYYLNNDENFPSVVLAPYNDELGGTVGYDMNPGIAPWTEGEWQRRRHEIRLEHRFNENFRFLAIGVDDFSDVEQLTSFSNFAGARDVGYEHVRVPPAEHILINVMPIYEKERDHRQYFEANLLARFQTGYFKSDTLIGISASRNPTEWADDGYFAPDVSQIGQIDYTLESPYTVRASDPLEARYYRPDTDPSEWERWLPAGTAEDWGKTDLFITENLTTLDDRLHILGGLRLQQYQALQVDRTLPQIGATYELTDQFAVYAIWSETAEDNGRTRRYNEPRPLSESRAWDVGVKFALLNETLTGTVTYFHIEKSNLAISDPRLNVDYAAGLVDDTVIFTPGSESKGVELSIQYQPTPSLQFTASYAHTDGKILPGDPNPARDNSPLIQAIPDALTFFGKYTFREGRFQGLALGGGFVRNWGPIYIDNPITSALYNDDHTLVNAFIRYSFELMGRQTRLELAGNNLTDERLMMDGGFSPPREALFSVAMDF